jgi:hypothetical protein
MGNDREVIVLDSELVDVEDVVVLVLGRGKYKRLFQKEIWRLPKIEVRNLRIYRSCDIMTCEEE